MAANILKNSKIFCNFTKISNCIVRYPPWEQSNLVFRILFSQYYLKTMCYFDSQNNQMYATRSEDFIYLKLLYFCRLLLKCIQYVGTAVNAIFVGACFSWYSYSVYLITHMHYIVIWCHIHLNNKILLSLKSCHGKVFLVPISMNIIVRIPIPPLYFLIHHTSEQFWKKLNSINKHRFGAKLQN